MTPITRYSGYVTLWAFAVSIMAGFVQGSGSKSTKSFTDTCLFDRCKFRNNHVMGTYCNNNNEKIFDYDWTQIDLGRCLGNNDGSIVGYKNGEFHKSCNDCRLTNNRDDETQYIVCDCSNLQGKRVKSRFDLDEVMYNDDGTLGCFGHLGSKFSRPPKEWDDEDDPAASGVA